MEGSVLSEQVLQDLDDGGSRQLILLEVDEQLGPALLAGALIELPDDVGSHLGRGSEDPEELLLRSRPKIGQDSADLPLDSSRVSLSHADPSPMKPCGRSHVVIPGECMSISSPQRTKIGREPVVVIPLRDWERITDALEDLEAFSSKTLARRISRSRAEAARGEVTSLEDLLRESA